MELDPFRFSCGSVSLDLLAASDLDRLVGDDLDPERLPFWAVLWPSGDALARRLAAAGGWAETDVLELGCGAGLVGLALAALGARVTQTDRFPEAAALARSNARRNRLTGCRQLAADWRAWPLRGGWAAVVASDVTYQRSLHGPLLRVVELSLAPGGTAWIADPGRPMSLDFFALAESRGWHVTLDEVPSGSGGETAFVYRLQR